jgi:hypothetical protein
VESPSSDVNVAGVGGTTLTLDSNGAESSELAWSYSGGGVSEYFTRPSWQIGTGMPSGTMRAVPDVACPADPNNGAVLFYNGAQTVVGGTSWSSPTWAGYCALINQARSNAGGVSGAQYALRRLVTHGPSGGLNCGNAGSLVAALLGVAMGRAFDQRLCPIFGGRLYLERIDHCFARHAFTILEGNRRCSRIHACHANGDQFFHSGASLDRSVIPAARC